MNLSNWAFQNKKLIYFLIAVLVLGGIWSAYDMSKLEDPEIKVKTALIATTYPGASAHEVEMEVTDPLVQQQALNRSDISSRPEFAILQSQVEMARQNVNLQRSELLPTLGVMGAYGYANGIKVNGNKLIDRSSYAVMLKLSIPIYHFGERTNKVRAAKAQLRQKELEQESLQEQMLLELTQEANRLDEAFKETEISAKALESAQENIKVSQKHYENGMETLTGLLEAQTLWQQAYEKEVEAHFNLYTQYVTYLKASGQLN